MYCILSFLLFIKTNSPNPVYNAFDMQYTNILQM